MAIQRVDSIYDMAAIEAEHIKLKGFIKNDAEGLMALYEAIKSTKGATLGSLPAETEKLGAAIDNTKKKQSDLSLATQEYGKILNSNAIAQAKMNAQTSEAGVESAKLNIQLSQQKKANKEVAQEALGMIDAYGQLKKQYEGLANAAKNAGAVALNTGNPEDIEKAKAAAAAAKELHDQLLTIETGVGQSQRNMGNYTGAINILKTSLEEATAQLAKMNEQNSATAASQEQMKADLDAVTQKINQERETLAALNEQQKNAGVSTVTYASDINNVSRSLTSNIEQQSLLTTQIEAGTAAINQNDQAMQQQQTEVNLLTQLVGVQSKGYTTLAREVASTGKALETMASQGLVGTEAFEKLQKEFTLAKDKLKDFQNEQKILTSDTPKLNALVAAAKGLGGIYAAAQGGAALFAGENEEVQKSLNKLVAVMTLLQGLDQIHELFEQKNAIATALFGKATQASTVSVKADTVAKIANIAATTKSAAAEAESTSVLKEVEEAGNQVTEAKAEVEELSAQATELASLANEKLAVSTEVVTVTTGEETAALEAQAIAAEESAVATGTFSKALAFVAANPIILFLSALAGVLIYLVATYKSEEEQIKENMQASKDYSDAISLETSTLLAANEQLNKRIELQIRDLQNERDLKASRGTTNSEELAFNTKILKLKQEIATANVNAVPDIESELKDANTEYDKLLKNQTDLDLFAKRAAENRKRAVADENASNIAYDIYGMRSSTAVEVTQKEQKAGADALAATKKNIDQLTKLKEDKVAADTEVDKNAAAAAKLSADEARKYTLALAQIEFTAEQDKNNRILANEHSTFEKRIQAMKDNQSAMRTIAKAEESDVLNDPTKSATDKAIAEKQYAAKVIEINKNTQEEIRKATEEDNKRRAQAETEAKKILLSIDKDFQDTLINDDQQTKATRLTALAKYLEDQQNAIDLDYELTKKNNVLTKEELIKLDQDYYAKSEALAADGHKKLQAINSSDLGKVEEQHDKEYAAIEKQYNKLSDLAAESYNNQIVKLNDQYSQGKLSLEQYNKDRLAIDNKYSKASVSIEIDRQKALIADIDYANGLKLDLEKQLADEKAKLASAQTDKDKIAAGEQIKFIEDQLKKTIAVIDKESALYKQLSALIKQLSDANKKGSEDNNAEILKTIGTISKDVTDYFGVVDGILNAISTKRKNQIADEQAALDEKTQSDIDNVNKSVESEDQKAKDIALINANAAAKKADLDRRSKQADIEQAKFDKVKALFEVAINTATAIVKDLGDPWKIAFDIVLGAAQTAIILATPLPHYKTGRGTGKRELAVLGDGGVSEYVHHADGSIDKTPAVDTLYDLMPTDKVYKDKDSMMKAVAESSNSLSSWNVDASGNISKNDMQAFAGQIVEAVGNIQVHTTQITKSGWRTMNNRISEKQQWVDRVIKGKI